MSFNSYIFILCLLPISFIGYFALSRKKQEYGLLWMAASSLVFYAWAGISILLLFIASLILNYIFTLFIKRSNSKLILALGIILNVILLIYFKYSGFLVQNINALFNTGNAEGKPVFPNVMILLATASKLLETKSQDSLTLSKKLSNTFLWFLIVSALINNAA